MGQKTYDVAKKVIVSAMTLGALVGVAHAQSTPTPATATPPTQSQTIVCLTTAVSSREQALGTAVTAYGNGIIQTYSARTAALQQAYTKTSRGSIRSAVRQAWSSFTSSMKSVQTAWKSARGEAWKQFASAAKVCKAPAMISDTGHAGN